MPCIMEANIIVNVLPLMLWPMNVAMQNWELYSSN